MDKLPLAVVGFAVGAIFATTVSAYAASPAEEATADINQAIALLESAKRKLATPTPSPTATGLPVRVLSVWHHRWEGPNLRAYPPAAETAINLHVAGLAQSAAPGTGAVEYAPANGQTPADHAADIAALRAQGEHVLLGVGGGGDGGITLTTAAHADQAANTVGVLADRYGFTGVDLDLEDPARWNEATLLRLTDLLRAARPGFLVGVTAALYAERTARWLSFMRACATRCAYLAVMLYDFPEAGDTRLTAVALAKADAMVAGGLPPDKIVLGFMPRPTAAYLNATPLPSLAVNAWLAVRARYPAARGVFIWEDRILAARAWDFVTALDPHT